MLKLFFSFCVIPSHHKINVMQKKKNWSANLLGTAHDSHNLQQQQQKWAFILYRLRAWLFRYKRKSVYKWRLQITIIIVTTLYLMTDIYNSQVSHFEFECQLSLYTFRSYSDIKQSRMSEWKTMAHSERCRTASPIVVVVVNVVVIVAIIVCWIRVFYFIKNNNIFTSSTYGHFSRLNFEEDMCLRLGRNFKCK